MKILLLITTIVLIAGCTDAEKGKIFNLGENASIKCYSGGIVTYDGYSTGKIKSEENSDGYYFIEKSTGNLMEVSGDCVINYNN